MAYFRIVWQVDGLPDLVVQTFVDLRVAQAVLNGMTCLNEHLANCAGCIGEHGNGKGVVQGLDRFSFWIAV